MSEQTNTEVALRIYDAFVPGTLGVLSLIDERAELIFEGNASIPWSGNRQGRTGWAQFFQTLAENVDEITIAMEPFAAQGDNVVAAGRYQGKVRRTNRRIDSPLVHLWTARNSLVVRCQELTNTAAEVAACSAGASTQ